MIGSGSTLQVSDNSGAKLVQCIQPSGKSYTIGDVITVAVKAAGRGKIAAGTVQKAVIVETKKVSFSCAGCSMLYVGNPPASAAVSPRSSAQACLAV